MARHKHDVISKEDLDRAMIAARLELHAQRLQDAATELSALVHDLREENPDDPAE